MTDRLQQFIAFIVETDKLKTVLRKTSPIGLERKENSAEHSWQVALAACMLAEYANHPIDILRVLKMLLVHDLAEIDIGDTFHYDKPADGSAAPGESVAAERIFSLLPSEEVDNWLSLSKEYEAKQSNESRFANAIDRLMPLLLNYYHSNGGSWKEFRITAAAAIEKNKHIEEGSKVLWEFVEQLIESGSAKNLFGE